MKDFDKIISKISSKDGLTDDESYFSFSYILEGNANEDQIEKFHSNEAKIYLGIEHKNYSHITILNDENINNLKEDLL